MFALFAKETRETRGLRADLAKTRENLRAAQGHRAVVESERDVWMRRAIEFSETLTDTALDLRAARRELAEAKDRLRKQEDLLIQLQDTNERHYRELAEKSGAQPAMQAAAA